MYPCYVSLAALTQTDTHDEDRLTLMSMRGGSLEFTEPCIYPCHVRKEREKNSLHLLAST
jgi:hypothetical protein